MSQATLGAIRHILTLVGGWLIASGWLDPNMLDQVVGAVMALFGFVWSWYYHTSMSPPPPSSNHSHLGG